MRCFRCRREAAAFIRYSGSHLCSEHFTEFVHDRVYRDMRKQMPLPSEGVAAVAISGGKDSALAARMMRMILEPRKKVRLHAVLVDEGIAGYRPRTIKAARRLAEAEGVPLTVISFEDEFGFTLDQAVRRANVMPCSLCGVLRRLCINTASRRLGASVVATGHNLDDVAQSIAMNLFKGDIDRLLRMAPHRRRIPGLVPRVLPLRTIPEKECFLYSTLEKLPFEHAECPYADSAQRGLFSDMVFRAEDAAPGTRHALLGTLARIQEMADSTGESPAVAECPECGEMTAGGRCKACSMVEDVKRKMGASRGRGRAKTVT